MRSGGEALPSGFGATLIAPMHAARALDDAAQAPPGSASPPERVELHGGSTSLSHALVKNRTAPRELLY
jgi:hypothetical protein